MYKRQNLGLAFQIVDDLMDFNNSPNKMGKNLGDDFKLGKTTLPVILAWQKSNPKEKQFWIKTLKELNQENFDFIFYIAGVDIHFNDRLGKLKISDEGIKLRDELVVENFFSRRIPFCGVLGGGYNKDFNKLVELHSMLHLSLIHI